MVFVLEIIYILKKKFIKEQAKGLKTYVCNVPMLAYTF